MKQVDAVSSRPALWFGLFAGPLAWTLHELLSYALVRFACANNTGFLLNVVTLGCLAIAAAGGYVALRAYGMESHDEAKFLAGAGVLVSGLFIFAIVMESIPNMMVSPCL